MKECRGVQAPLFRKDEFSLIFAVKINFSFPVCVSQKEMLFTDLKISKLNKIHTNFLFFGASRKN